MSAHIDEEQQIEAIKKFWQRYGQRILTVALVIALIFLGWRWWEQRQEQHRILASKTYEQLLSHINDEDTAILEAAANGLIRDYADTVYAEVAGLILARKAVYAGDYVEAETHLNWVIDKAKQAIHRQLAKIRLARIKLDQKKYSDALNVLQQVDAPAFMAMVVEVRGDVYLAQGDLGKARSAYLSALETLPSEGVSSSLLQLKYNDVSGVRKEV